MTNQKPLKKTHPPQGKGKCDCDYSGTVQEVNKAMPTEHNNQPEAMDLDIWEAATVPPPPPIVRPPVKGVTKRLEEYPPEIRSEEDRRAYDELSSGIQALLGRREELMKGIKTKKVKSPPSRPSPPPVTPPPPRKPYAEVVKTPAAPGSGGTGTAREEGRTKKKASRRTPSLTGHPPPVQRNTGVPKTPVSANRGTAQPTTSANKRGARQPIRAVARETEPSTSKQTRLPPPSEAQAPWVKVERRKAPKKSKAAKPQPAQASSKGSLPPPPLLSSQRG